MEKDIYSYSEDELKNLSEQESKDVIKQIGDEIEDIRLSVQLKKVADIVSISYIAKEYFGKSRSWLHQRLNGDIVNGKPVKFTPEERSKLKEALKDISRIICEESEKI